MKNKIIKTVAALTTVATCAAASLTMFNVQAAESITSNKTGTVDGYNYELWKDSGNTTMTLNGGGKFNCEWSNINNALFRIGKKFDSSKTYQQLGNITVDYGCEYNPSGNSYLCVYGWTKSPLVEYYVVDSWGSWRPPGSSSKGTISVDGGTYDVYETTRTNQPSIEGTKTFQQYWSVRTSKRTSGKISLSDHFKAWENKGMQMGKMYEAALTVEGYQSSGKANVYKNDITIGGSSDSGSGNNDDSNSGTTNTSAKMECEKMNLSGQYAGKVNSPFSGVALYANNDACKFTQSFTKGNYNFSLRGCSDGSQTAKVDLKINGQKKGTFSFSGTNPSVSTINNVSVEAGNQQIELVVTSDNGKWDAFIDYLEFK